MAIQIIPPDDVLHTTMKREFEIPLQRLMERILVLHQIDGQMPSIERLNEFPSLKAAVTGTELRITKDQRDDAHIRVCVAAEFVSLFAFDPLAPKGYQCHKLNFVL